jgi:hypothetical protein
MMRIKVKDAENEEIKAKFESDSCRREYKEWIVQGDIGHEEFENVAKQIVERLWYVKIKQIRKSFEEKKNFYKVKKDVSDIKGIRIVSLVVYDNIEVTTNMKAALTISPGFMLYPKIKIEEVETEFEKGLLKVRYCLMSKYENKNNNSDNRS